MGHLAEPAALEARDLTFEYPGVRALDGVTFSLPRAAIAALVGPNGAGKSTLLRCLAALSRPFAGSARIAGVDTAAAPRRCHRLLGYLPDFYGLYDDLTAARCLEHAARSRGIPRGESAAAVARTAERLGIADRLGAKAAELSRGQRQALAIGQAIIHAPEVLLLDEPAAGLDPEARRNLARLLRSLREAGMTILVSSHILAELEEYATEMLVLRAGRLVHRRDFGGRAGGTRTLEVRVVGGIEGLAAALAALPGVAQVEPAGQGARFSFSGGAAEQHHVLRALVESGFAVTSFAEPAAGLQAAYFEIAGAPPPGGAA